MNAQIVLCKNVNDKEESLHAACIDPCDVTRFVREIPGVLHMSGTLQPLDQYVKVMGLSKDCYQRIYPSPFPKENRSVIYLGNVTTRYEDTGRGEGGADYVIWEKGANEYWSNIGS